MNIEKLVNSKIYTFFDWVWRIFVLNVLTMVTSLGVITIFPSIVSCFQSIKDFKEGTDESIFKVYFRNFGHYFKKTVVMGIIILLVAVILIYGVIFYGDLIKAMDLEGGFTDAQMLVPTLGYYIVLFLLFLVLLIVNQLPIIYSYFNFRFFDNFKFALYMTFKFLFQSFIEVLVWGLSILIFFFANPVWFFIGISAPLFLIYSISRPIYWYLANSRDVVIHDKDNEEKEGTL